MIKKKKANPRKWANRRHLVQGLCLLAFFLLPLPLPFLPGFESGALKLDFSCQCIHFFGIPLVQGLWQYFFFAIFLASCAIALLTKMYSKVFCGWLCPQNIFIELFSKIQVLLKKYFPRYRRSPKSQQALEAILSLVVALLLAYGSCAYFIDASPIFIRGLFIAIFTFAFYDLWILKHRFCQSVCPYAYLQRGFQEETSLHVAWEKRKGSPCGSCRACEKACYVDIDVKKDPFHIDCTMCGACIDACENVFRNQEEPSLLRFAFDEKEASPNFIQRIGISTYSKGFLLAIFITSLALFTWKINTRPSLIMRIDYPLSGTKNQLPYYEEDKLINAYRIILRNLTKKAKDYQLVIENEGFSVHGLKKVSSLSLKPLESTSSAFTVAYGGDPSELPPVTLLRLSLFHDGKHIETQERYFRPVQ